MKVLDLRIRGKARRILQAVFGLTWYVYARCDLTTSFNMCPLDLRPGVTEPLHLDSRTSIILYII